MTTVAVATALIPVADAAAHTMPQSTAYTVAKKAAAKVATQTHASSWRVLSCKRKTAHRFLCKGQTKYRTGASPCLFDIPVRYTSRTKRTTAYAVTNYRCF